MYGNICATSENLISYRINRKRSNILILTHLIIGHRNFFIKVYDGKNRIISKNEELTNE